jgi:hypothetical protein
MQRQNWSDEAESLFRAFALRHKLKIYKVDQSNIELFMIIPKQDGLSFELSLGLQNLDEINIGFEGFWSYFFPFADQQGRAFSILDAIVKGTCRLNIQKQFGKVRNRKLELLEHGQWIPVYNAVERLSWPVIRKTSEFIINQKNK